MGFDEEKEVKTERKKKEKRFSLRQRCKGKGLQIGMLVVILAIAGLAVQNGFMLQQMEKVLGQAEVAVHEIYDNTDIIAAYKTEDTKDDEKLDAEALFVLDKAKEILSEIITEDMTDYEKEKAVYDWQVNWVNYQDNNLSPITGGQDKSHLPYGVLKYHQAICVGNATTFQLFMNMLDIPCEIIHSTQEGEHAWNVVQLDGEWYHVDVTFDNGSSGKCGYTYFNVPDSVKDDGSWPWDHDKIPAANGTKYCYKLTSANTVDDFYDIPNVIKEEIDKGNTSISLILKDNKGFTRDIAEYIGNNIYVEDGSVYYDNAYALGGKTVYCYSVSIWGEGTNHTGDADVYEKLDRIISDLNGGMIADNGEEIITNGVDLL